MTVLLKIINIMVRYDMNEQMPEYQLEFLLA
ncbi:MAG: hypothetical protein QOF32_1138, partial [Gammaproteobacteria bacterium]|nr:hypothetical protein [Gammaproteobacteria bacterium]